jgi:hypothetical protein
MEDVNVYRTTTHPKSVIICMSADLEAAGCAVTITDPYLSPGYSVFRYRNGVWQWQVNKDQWVSADSWIDATFSASFVDVSRVDPNFAFVEVYVQAEEWTGPDVEFNWPDVTDEVADVGQRILRGLDASYIGGSELPCIDAAELLGTAINPPILNSIERVVSEMQEIVDQKVVQNGNTLEISFTLQSEETGQVSVELNNVLQ